MGEKEIRVGLAIMGGFKGSDRDNWGVGCVIGRFRREFRGEVEFEGGG